MSVIRNRAAVLGKPIAHSLSPVLHNAAYSAMGLDDWEYGRAEVTEEELSDFISKTDQTWRGLSLTMPLKKTIGKMGSSQDKWSQVLGVANTVVFETVESKDSENPEASTRHEAGIKLYNTDVFGIEAALNDTPNDDDAVRAAFTPVTRPCMVLGSGSTAASALAALSELGAKRVIFAARHPLKAMPLLQLAESLGVKAEAVSLDGIDGGDLRNLQYLVSTIPAHGADGLAGKLKASTYDLVKLTLLDVVYDPRPTALMKAVRDRGGVTVGGHIMLLWQAVRQVALMTREREDAVPVAAMRAALEEALGTAK